MPHDYRDDPIGALAGTNLDRARIGHHGADGNPGIWGNGDRTDDDVCRSRPFLPSERKEHKAFDGP